MEPRLSEMKELYESIGFEVLLEPLPTEEELSRQGGCADGECRACFEEGRENYRVIFTRPREGSTPS